MGGRLYDRMSGIPGAERGSRRRGLGFLQLALHEPGEVLMFRVAEKVVLSLWAEAFFVEEVGQRPARGGVPPVRCPSHEPPHLGA